MSWIQNIYGVRMRRSNNRTKIPTTNATQQGFKKQENALEKDLEQLQSAAPVSKYWIALSVNLSELGKVTLR